MSNCRVEQRAGLWSRYLQSPDFETDCVAEDRRDLIWMKFNSGKVCTRWNRHYEHWPAKDQMPSGRIIREIKRDITANGGIDIHGYVS